MMLVQEEHPDVEEYSTRAFIKPLFALFGKERGGCLWRRQMDVEWVGQYAHLL
jgi:hypothetical protein